MEHLAEDGFQMVLEQDVPVRQPSRDAKSIGQNVLLGQQEAGGAMRH